MLFILYFSSQKNILLNLSWIIGDFNHLEIRSEKKAPSFISETLLGMMMFLIDDSAKLDSSRS